MLRLKRRQFTFHNWQFTINYQVINLQERPQLLEERTLKFATDIVQFCKGLSRTTENNVISVQLIKSASSVGANYAEANNASSRIDFRNKIYIAKKEAAEARYWLKLAVRVDQSVNADDLIDEVSQLIFILQKISSTLKNGK